MNDRVVEVLATTLDLEPALIRDDLVQTDVPTWDSFAHVMLVTNLESAFDLRISPADAVSLRSVRDIREFLRRHGVEA